MPSMSYCMFENTYIDLKRCYNRLEEAESLEELTEEMSKEELMYFKAMFTLCEQVATRYRELNMETVRNDELSETFSPWD